MIPSLSRKHWRFKKLDHTTAFDSKLVQVSRFSERRTHSHASVIASKNCCCLKSSRVEWTSSVGGKAQAIGLRGAAAMRLSGEVGN